MAATTLSPAPQNVQLSSLRNLNFTIMETRCQARSGAQLDSCEFKEDGVSTVLGWWVLGGSRGEGQPRVQCPHCSQLVKDCAAPVVLQGGRAVSDVTCVDSMADVSGDTMGGGPRGVWDPLRPGSHSPVDDNTSPHSLSVSSASGRWSSGLWLRDTTSTGQSRRNELSQTHCHHCPLAAFHPIKVFPGHSLFCVSSE